MRIGTCIKAGAFACAAVVLAAQVAAEERRMSPLRVKGPTNGNGVTALTFDADAYEALRGAESFVLTQVPLTDRRLVDVEARRVEAFTEDAVIVVGGAEGESAVERPDVIVLSGSVVGAPESHVTLGFSAHGCNGIIELDGQTHLVSAGPLGGTGPVVYNFTTLPQGVIDWVPFQCGSDLLAHPPRAPQTLGTGGSAPAGDPPCRVVNVAIETDYEYTRDIFGGDTNAAAAYATTLVAAVGETTLRDLNVHLKIAYLRTWSANNDPYTANNSWDRFFEYQDHWNANMRHIVRDNVHMFSALRDGQIGGLAYLPGVCQTDYDYAYSSYLNGFFPYPLQDHHDQNWDVFVVGHEEGHNLGAPHTHDHNPPIDGCGLGDCNDAFGGTYMSYCHGCSGGMTNIVLAYHDRTIHEAILPYLGDAPCNLEDDPPCTGGVDCDRISELSVTCRQGRFKLKAVVKSTLAEGTTLTLTRDGSDSQAVSINSRGKARAVWKNVAGGGHDVCIDECPALCGSASCNP